MTVKTRAAKRKKKQRAKAHQQQTKKPDIGYGLVQIGDTGEGVRIPSVGVDRISRMEPHVIDMGYMSLSAETQQEIETQVHEMVEADQIAPSRHPCPTCARSEKVTKKGLMSRHDYKAEDGTRKECPGTGRSFLVSEH